MMAQGSPVALLLSPEYQVQLAVISPICEKRATRNCSSIGV